jgi:hypothetical protein
MAVYMLAIWKSVCKWETLHRKALYLQEVLCSAEHYYVSDSCHAITAVLKFVYGGWTLSPDKNFKDCLYTIVTNWIQVITHIAEKKFQSVF